MEGVGFAEQWVLFGRGCLGSRTALKPKLGSTLEGDLWFFLQLLKLAQCLMPNAHGPQMMCWVSRYCLISLFQRQWYTAFILRLVSCKLLFSGRICFMQTWGGNETNRGGLLLKKQKTQKSYYIAHQFVFSQPRQLWYSLGLSSFY